MGRRRKARNPPPTTWRVPEDLWDRIEPLLAELDPPRATGMPRIDAGAALGAILHRMSSGSVVEPIARRASRQQQYPFHVSAVVLRGRVRPHLGCRFVQV